MLCNKLLLTKYTPHINHTSYSKTEIASCMSFLFQPKFWCWNPSITSRQHVCNL